VKAVTFDGAIGCYLASRAAGLVSSRWLTGPGRCTRLQDVPVPALPADDWVRVRTRLGGICGSDLNLVRLDVSPSTSPFSSFPFVIGHENVGVIEEAGPAAGDLRVGERVVVNPLLSCVPRGIDPACHHCASGRPSRCENFTVGRLPAGMLLGTTRSLGGSWGEAYVAHVSQIVRVPERVSDRGAVLLEPLATVMAPILDHPPADGAQVLVIGGGSIGLLTVAALRALAPGVQLTALARHRFQAEHAERLGAHHVVVPREAGDYYRSLSDLTGGRLLRPILGPRIHIGGFDHSYVCVGNSRAVDDALRFTRAGGHVVMLGNVAQLPKVDWTPLWLKELTVRGSLCYGRHAHGGTTRHAFDVGMQLLAEGLADAIEPLVTDVFPLHRFEEALARSMTKSRHPSIKIVFDLDDR
jgi:L-iditol 2-dehydrogenase